MFCLYIIDFKSVKIKNKYFISRISFSLFKFRHFFYKKVIKKYTSYKMLNLEFN